MKIIAEIGTAHGGDLEKAKKLIDAAAESGADYIKFQWVYADEILHPDTGFVNLPGGKTPLFERFKALEVDSGFYKECLDYTHSLGKKFICSPFGIRSLSELAQIEPDAIKIASPELNHTPLLSALSEIRKSTKIETVVSSGVSKLRDIERALEILGTDNLTLLHCVTSYPAPESDYNLNLIPNLSAIFGVQCGVSDHSLDPILVPSIAAAVGATILEKHITLSRKTDGLDDPVALETEQFALMTHCVRQCEAAFRQYPNAKDYILGELSKEYGNRVQEILGSGVKKLAPSEKANYGRTNRSIHFLRAMKKGEKVQENDIGILRTEKILLPGIEPDFLSEILGATLSKDVPNGKGAEFSDFIEK